MFMQKGFKGYYIKCVDKDFQAAVIFGRNKCRGESSAFIQVITKDASHWFDFPYDQFTDGRRDFLVGIGGNVATREGMILDLDNGQVKIKCEVRFGRFTPIKYEAITVKRCIATRYIRRRCQSTSAMGPFRFLPFMECRHMVASMDHTVSGTFSVGDKEHIFDNADGYIEGDRGRSFPKRYLWSQCNSFDKGCGEKSNPPDHVHSGRSGTSVAAMCARIPYLGVRFLGTICIVRHHGREYRLATYTGARVVRFERDNLVVERGRGRKKMRLDVTAVDAPENMKELFAPTGGKMSRIIKETIITPVRYVFTIGGEVVFDLTGDIAAFEYGDTE